MENAPIEFPVYVVNGAFFDADGEFVVGVPRERDVSNATAAASYGWGTPGSIYIDNKGKKVIPSRLQVEWFSFREDSFFRAKIEMPKEKIVELFKRGPNNSKTHLNVAPYDVFSQIIIGFAPKGLVNIWIGGWEKRFIMSSQGKKVDDIPWTKVLKNPDINRKQYIEQKLNDIFSSYNLGKPESAKPYEDEYEKYNQTFNWKPVVEGAQVDWLVIETFNGEKYRLVPQELKIKTTGTLPKSIEVHFTLGNEKLFNRIHLDFFEIYNLLKTKSKTSNTDDFLIISVGKAKTPVKLQTAPGKETVLTRIESKLLRD